MSQTKKLQTFNIKKDSRRQAKKRKLEAFLDLVRKDELAPAPGKKKSGGTFQENYKALKDELRKYQQKKTADPSFSLKDSGRCAFVKILCNGEISSSTSPLFVEDIYYILMASVLGNLSPFPCRWAKLEHAQNISKTVLIEIEGLSQKNVSEMYSNLNQNSDMFSFIVGVVSADTPFTTDLSTVHLPTGLCNQSKKGLSSLFPVDQTSLNNIENNDFDYKLSKLHLLLSPIQLAMEHYPLPLNVFEQSKSDGYCFSKESYTAVHEKSPMFAVDCEMCRTLPGKHEVTRIAIVNENLETVYETLVKPKEDIIDYITRFSGITERMLRHVTTSLDDVQKRMREILPSDAILCGQSLNCDLHGLKMIHPYVIDTSIIFNKYGIRSKKTSLKQLVRMHLKESIQDDKNGHNPIEDAIATMKLVQLKLKNNIEYGDAVLDPSRNKQSSDENEAATSVSSSNRTSTIYEFMKSNPDLREKSFFSRLSRFSKKACLIGSENSLSNYYEEMITENVTKVVKSKTKKVIKAISDNVENYDLILSHTSLDAENCPEVHELSDEIKQIYATFPNRTLFIIYLSGVNKEPTDKFKHNFCMVTLKK